MSSGEGGIAHSPPFQNPPCLPQDQWGASPPLETPDKPPAAARSPALPASWGRCGRGSGRAATAVQRCGRSADGSRRGSETTGIERPARRVAGPIAQSRGQTRPTLAQKSLNSFSMFNHVPCRGLSGRNGRNLPLPYSQQIRRLNRRRFLASGRPRALRTLRIHGYASAFWPFQPCYVEKNEN